MKRIFDLLRWYHFNKMRLNFACDIEVNAILKNVKFPHPIGIVIGGGAHLENGVVVLQNVTIGALQFDKTKKVGIFAQQFIGEDTIIGTGSKILGDVKIGKNCIIGANSVVTVDVPDNSRVVGYNKISALK